jgi:tetratricopeptide (TPR) repeat protein
MRSVVPLVPLVLLLFASAGVWAQDASGDVEAARAHFKKGNTAFDLQHYVEAAHEYEAAYQAKDDPALLYNIGQAYRLAGDPAHAVGAYKAYLRRRPDARNRADVEVRIAALQKLVKDEQRSREAPPEGAAPDSSMSAGTGTPAGTGTTPGTGTTTGTTTTTPAAEVATAPPRPRKYRWLGLGVGLGGVAVAAVGATLVGLAYSTQSTYSHPGANTTYDPSAESRIRAEQAAGGVLLGVGAGALVAGSVLYALGARR